jgi:hypothetical protein
MKFRVRSEATAAKGETIMPKKVTISLSGIVKQIDQATGKLSAARGKAATGLEKRELAAKIKNLKKIKKLVREHCRGLNIIVPIDPTD